MKVKVEQLADYGVIYQTTRAMVPGHPEEFYSVGDDTWFRITIDPPDMYAEAMARSLRGGA